MSDKPEALRLAVILEDEKMHSMAIDTEAAAELRRLHAKCEALTADTLEEMDRITEIHRLRALNAELVEALRRVLEVWQDDPAYGHGAADKAWELLVKIEASND